MLDPSFFHATRKYDSLGKSVIFNLTSTSCSREFIIEGFIDSNEKERAARAGKTVERKRSSIPHHFMSLKYTITAREVGGLEAVAVV